MRFIYIFILTFIASYSQEAAAQKYLILERTGTVKTQRFGIFENIRFQLKDDQKVWYERQIMDLDANGQMILLGDTWFQVRDLSRIHLKRKRALATIAGGAMQGGGASMILGDIYYTLILNDPIVTQGGLEFGALNIAAGTALRALLGPIKYRLGKKTRMRVIDITYRDSKT